MRSVLDAGSNPGDAVAATIIAEAMQPDALEKRAGLRTEETGAAASEVAAVPGVRAALLDFQRRFAATLLLAAKLGRFWMGATSAPSSAQTRI